MSGSYDHTDILADNPKEDPLAAPKGNNNIQSLLTNDGPQQTTIPFIVGYNFVPPEPSWPKVNFPSFNVVVSMSEGVFQEEEKRQGRASIVKPLIADFGEEKRPRLPYSAAPEAVPELKEWWVKDKDGKEEWDSASEWAAVKSSWGGANDDQTQKLADAVTSAFGWTFGDAAIVASAPQSAEPATGDASTEPSTGPTDPQATEPPAVEPPAAEKPLTETPGAASLIGKKPAQFLSEFDRYFMSPPWVTVA